MPCGWSRYDFALATIPYLSLPLARSATHLLASSKSRVTAIGYLPRSSSAPGRPSAQAGRVLPAWQDHARCFMISEYDLTAVLIELSLISALPPYLACSLRDFSFA